MSAVLLIALALQGEPKFTDREILSRTRAQWSDYYAEKLGGGSTMAYVQAETLYGEALQRRNDARLPAKSWIREIREPLMDFHKSVVDYTYARAGGGTMYHIFYAGGLASVEEVVASLLQPKRRAPKRVVSQVTRQLDRMSRNLNENRADVDATASISGGYAAAKKGLAEARSAYGKVTAILAKRPRAESDRVLDACLKWSQMPNGFIEGD